MGPWGTVIMGFFGGVFFAAADVIALGWNFTLIVPVLVFGAMATIAARKIGQAPAGRFDAGRKAGRIIAAATSAEGVGIPMVALVLLNTGHGDEVLPGIAVVVGLHFLPMAYGIPFRPFYVLGSFLLLGAVAGFLLRQPEGSIVAGMAAAGVLWAASWLALRGRRRFPLARE